jgi:glycosyltransferase involved in cell wall biosynthesis
MKILVIANHLLDKRISSGGDRISVEMAERWGKWGAALTLLAPEIAAETVAKEIGAGDKIIIPRSRLDQIASKNVAAILPLYLWRTIGFFRSADHSTAFVLYTTGDFFCDVLPAFYLQKKLQVRWVANIYHINESPFVRKGNSFLASAVSFVLQRFSFQFIKRGADVIFLNNQGVKDGLVKMGFASEKMFVTGLGGIDVEKFKVQSSKFKVYDGVFLGRLNPTKGIFDLPKIWQKMVEKMPAAKLVIIGGGEEWAEKLRAQIRDLGLEKSVTLAGFVSEEEKLDLLNQSRVFVFPSYEEGWGIAVAEALAARLPVVAYDLPSYKEVFPKAFPTVKIGDTAAMSQMVLQLLQNENDYQLWQEKGYKAVQKYDLNHIAQQQWQIIRRAKIKPTLINYENRYRSIMEN